MEEKEKIVWPSNKNSSTTPIEEPQKQTKITLEKTSSTSNIELLIKKIHNELEKDTKDVKAFYEKLDEFVKDHPITLEELKLLPKEIDRYITNEQLPIFGSGFKNFVRKQKRSHEKEILKKKFEDEKNLFIEQLQQMFKKYVPGLYAPASFAKIQKLFSRARGEADSLTFEDDYENSFKEIKNNFSKKAGKVLTLSAAKKRKAGIIVGASIGGAVVIGTLICGAIPTLNYTEDYDGYYYGMVENGKHVLEVNPDESRIENGLKLTGVSGLFFPFHFPMKDITIPAEVNGIPVTGVDTYAFDEEGINSVTGGENLIWIGQYAFRDNNLKTLDFSESRYLTRIEPSAFSENLQLTSVKGLGSVRYIGDYAFENCNSLSEIDTLDYINRIGYGAFANTYLNSVNIGSNAQSIGYDAFDPNVKINYAGSFDDWREIYGGSNKTDFNYYIIRYDDPYSGTSHKKIQVGKNFTLNHVDKTGYKFEGYYARVNGREIKATDSNGYSTTSFINADVSKAKDYIDFYPKYNPIVYNVKFITNGGSSVHNYNYTVENNLNLDNITSSRTGYNFLGWSLNGYASGIIDSTRGHNDDLNLYAIWEKRTYKITTDVQDDTIKINYHYNDYNRTDKTETYNASSISIPNNLTRSGYYFGGWYLDSSFNTRLNSESDLSSNNDLYAKWISNSGSAYSTGRNNINNKQSTDISNSSITRVFRVDNGEGLNLYVYSYYSSPTTQVRVEDEYGNILVSTTTISYGSSNPTKIDIPSTTGNIRVIFTSLNYSDYTTLYTWFSNDSNITLNNVVTNTVVDVKFGDSYKLPIKEINGSVFKGYFTRPDGLGIKLTDENGNSIKNWDVDDNITAYPYYEQIDYTITYNIPDGVVNTNSNKTIYNYGDTYVLNDLEKTGYTFEGWYKDASLTNKVTSLDGLYENLELTPKFTPITVSLQLNGLDGIKRKVTFDYQDESLQNKVVLLDDQEVLYPPTDPAGTTYEWYYDAECTRKCYFDSTITKDCTLYGKKVTFVNNTSYEVLSSSNENNVNEVSVSNSSYEAISFVASKSGYVNLFARITANGNLNSYKLDVQVYNYTHGTTQIDTYVTSETYHKYDKIYVDQGDIIQVRYKIYSYSNNLQFYFKQSSSGVVDLSSNASSLDVQYDNPFEVEVPVKPGAEFKGYFTEPGGLGTMVIDSTGKSVNNSTFIENTSVYANFELTNYNIAYHIEGADNPNASLTTYNYGDTTTLESPVKTGYTFLGWFDGPNENASMITDLSSCIGDLDLYARFEGIKIDSTLNGNDSTSILLKFDYQDPTILNEEKYISSSESTVSLPMIKNNKYYAWYLDEECLIPVTSETIISSNCTLYAKELASVATSEHPNILSVDSTNAVTLDTDSTIKYYYVPFDMSVNVSYWNRYSGSYYQTHIYIYDYNESTRLFDSYASDTNVHNTTLSLTKGQVIQVYAHSASSYSNQVYCYFENATTPSSLNVSHSSIQQIEYGSSFTLPVREKLGYNFKGYYTEANGLGTKVTDENGASISNSTFTTDLNLYAYYEEATYTIEYVYDTTITNPNSSLVSYKYGDTSSISDLVVGTNYNFYGWYDNPNFLGSPINTLTGLHKNLTLYARVEEKTFSVVVDNLPLYTANRTVTVDYQLDGVENKTITTVGNENLVIPHHYRQGYRVEWYLDESYTIPFNQSVNHYGDFTIYAKWISLSSTAVNGQVSNYTKDNIDSCDVEYNYTSYYYTVDTDGVLFLNYRAKYDHSMNVKVMNQNGTQLGYAGSVYASTDYYVMKLYVTKGEKIQIKVDSNTSSYNNVLDLYFETKTEYSSSTSQVVDIKILSGLDSSIYTKEGYTFKGLYTYPNGQGTQIIDDTGAIVSEYTSGTLYAYYVAI